MTNDGSCSGTRLPRQPAFACRIRHRPKSKNDEEASWNLVTLKDFLMHTLSRSLVAEFIGTFALIFVGAGSATALGAGHIPAVALAHGLTIMVFASAFGDVSGCHINPAVTIGLATAGKFPKNHVVPYIVAQLLGGIAGAFLLRGIFGGPVNHLGATLIDTQRITDMGAFALECIGTFFLVNTVLNAAVRGGAGRLAPFAIGMTVTVCILFFGDLTGGSVNPARTIGPAIASGMYDGIFVYLAAQVVGAVLAGGLFRVLWSAPAQRTPTGSLVVN